MPKVKWQLAYERRYRTLREGNNGSQSYDLLSLGGQIADGIAVSAGKDAIREGKKIQDLDLPDLVTIATITRVGELIIPQGKTVLQEVDHSTYSS